MVLMSSGVTIVHPPTLSLPHHVPSAADGSISVFPPGSFWLGFEPTPPSSMMAIISGHGDSALSNNPGESSVIMEVSSG